MKIKVKKTLDLFKVMNMIESQLGIKLEIKCNERFGELCFRR